MRSNDNRVTKELGLSICQENLKEKCMMASCHTLLVYCVEVVLLNSTPQRRIQNLSFPFYV